MKRSKEPKMAAKTGAAYANNQSLTFGGCLEMVYFKIFDSFENFMESAVDWEEQDRIAKDIRENLDLWLSVESKATKLMLSELTAVTEENGLMDEIAAIDVSCRLLKFSSKQTDGAIFNKKFADFLLYARIVLLREDLERQLERWQSAVPQLQKALDLESLARRAMKASKIGAQL